MKKEEIFDKLYCIKRKAKEEVLEVHIDQSLMENIKNKFIEQKKAFSFEEENRVNFLDNGIHPLPKEKCFILNDFKNTFNFESINPESLHDNQLLFLKQEDINDIRAFFMISRIENDLTILIQYFDSRGILDVGNKIAFLSPVSWLRENNSNTFTRLKDNAVVLPNKLAAIYKLDLRNPHEGILLFRAFDTISRIFEMEVYYKAANLPQVRESFNNEAFCLTSPEDFFNKLSKNNKKRIGLLIRRETLKKITVSNFTEEYNFLLEELKQRDPYKDLGFEIKIENEKIAVPSDNKCFDKFLDFLLEGYSKGCFTGNIYLNNLLLTG